ncbi:cytochrome bd-I oxidase subunit CydX [Ralstonia sp. 22111]
MWYFSWVLGVGFAVLLAVLNAMWGEVSDDRAANASSANPNRE